MKEYVRAIFEQVATDRRRLRAVCNDDWMYEEPILREILSEHRIDDGKIEKALKEIYENDWYSRGGLSICVESFVLNELE